MRQPKKVRKGEKIAVVSPSFAAPGMFPAVHEQAMARLAAVTGLIPVEYPTTREVGASPQDRARDLSEAFRDPEIRAVIAAIGGTDQVTVIGHLDAAVIADDPKPFLGYSDNTHLLNWLWTCGVAGFYGGSTQVHLGPGPGIDSCHEQSLRAALLDGGRLELVEPGESEDFGVDWADDRALTEFGRRQPTGPWEWNGPARAVSSRTWGGCVDTFPALFIAGRQPDDFAAFDDGVLLLETAENLMNAEQFGDILRALGERGVLERASAVVIARPPATSLSAASELEPTAHRAAQRDKAFEIIERYNSGAVTVFGPPFGHTRPQWIVPYGGLMTLDGNERRVFADFG